jgi:hypothetical protein
MMNARTSTPLPLPVFFLWHLQQKGEILILLQIYNNTTQNPWEIVPRTTQMTARRFPPLHLWCIVLHSSLSCINQPKALTISRSYCCHHSCKYNAWNKEYTEVGWSVSIIAQGKHGVRKVTGICSQLLCNLYGPQNTTSICIWSMALVLLSSTL